MKLTEALDDLIDQDLFDGVFISGIGSNDVVLTECEYPEEEFRDKKIRHLKTIKQVCEERLEELSGEENKMFE